MNSSTPTTRFNLDSKRGMCAAHVLNDVSGVAWQDAHDLPLLPLRLKTSLPRSRANMAGFSVGSRLSRLSTGGGRVLGFSLLSAIAEGSRSVLRKATMSLISSSEKTL